MEFLDNLIKNLLSLNPIAKYFYLTLILLLFIIVSLKLILVPKTIIFLFTLIFVNYIKEKIYNFILYLFFKLKVQRRFLDSIEPISLLIPFTEVIINPYFGNLLFFPAIIWLKPINISIFNKRLLFFLSTIIHLFLTVTGLLILILLNYLNLTHSFYIHAIEYSLKAITTSFMFYFILINFTYVLLNLMPFYPFEMGIFLQYISFNTFLEDFFTMLNSVGSIVTLLLYSFNLIDYLNPYLNFLAILIDNLLY